MKELPGEGFRKRRMADRPDRPGRGKPIDLVTREYRTIRSVAGPLIFVEGCAGSPWGRWWRSSSRTAPAGGGR